MTNQKPPILNKVFRIALYSISRDCDPRPLDTSRTHDKQSLYDEAVVGGNSGGGLFIDGELVGNKWITWVVQEVTRATGTAVGPEQQTNLSIAAQLPF